MAAAKLQSYILHVTDPDIWKTLPPTAICTIFFPPDFADNLRPAFADILQSFYLLDNRKALDACAAFFTQLTAAKHQLGPKYDCTVASFCAIRTLLHVQMGYYTFPGDLPEPVPPYLQPIPPPGVYVSPERVTFRLASILFEHFKGGDASQAALGYTPQQHHFTLQSNALFFAHYAESRLPLLCNPQPLNDVDLLFWIFLPRFLSCSCTPAAMPTTNLLTPSTWISVWTRTVSPLLFAALARDGRVELLGILADELYELAIPAPANMTPLCQGLLYNTATTTTTSTTGTGAGANTRFRHVRLRHMAVTRSLHLSAADLPRNAKEAADAELAACVAICTDPGSGPALGALGALCGKSTHYSSLTEFVAGRAVWQGVGRLGFVTLLDFCQVACLLVNEEDELTLKTTGLDVGMVVLGRMYQGERERWGAFSTSTSGGGPGGDGRSWDGRWCMFAEGLNEWLETLLEMEPLRPAAVGVMLAFAVEYWRKAKDDHMRPYLEQEEGILGSCLALWAKYKTATHGEGVPPRRLLGVGREIGLMGVEWCDEQIRRAEQGGVPVAQDVTVGRATAMDLYLECSVLAARYAGGPQQIGSALERLEAKITEEAVLDSKQGLRANAVFKCSLLAVLSLYHPGRMHMRTPEEGGGSMFAWASRTVDDDSLWVNNAARRARARSYLQRARGGWLAWNGPDGERRRSGQGPRKVPASPDLTDVWTWEYELLGANPHLIDHEGSVLMIRERYLVTETQNMELRMRWDGYLDQCFRKAQEVLGAEVGTARFLIDG